MTNLDINSCIDDLKQTIDLDPHQGVHRFIASELLKRGIIDAMPERLADPYRPCPTDWIALQAAYFDNGEPERARKRYKRGADGKSREIVQRTKMRFGGNMKVWVRDKINFNNLKQVAWQANFYCWTAAEAMSVCGDLLDDKLVNRETVDLMRRVIDATGGDPTYRFSIPLLKLTGTRWMKEHIIVTVLSEDGIPERFSAVFPGQAGIASNEPLADALPNGKAYGKGVILQARIARSSDFEAWASEVQP